MFFVNLYKYGRSTYDYVSCYIRKNGSALIRVLFNPDSSSDGGNYASSNTVILHLRNGDSVDLGSCTSAVNFYRDPTSFSGFLLKSD